MKDRVVKGATEVMDRGRPGWHRRIDKEQLDMSSWCDCIGGQEEGNYDDFVDIMQLDLGSDWGFALKREDTQDVSPHVAWEKLRELWVEEIEARLLRDELEAGAKSEELALV